MLANMDPLLSGQLLHWLDEMGHGDAVVIADAQFPAHRLGARVLEMPQATSPRVLAAIRSVLPVDDDVPTLDLMATPDGQPLPIHAELVQAGLIGSQTPRYLPKPEFFAEAARSFLIVRTGELRIYGHAIFRKGIVRLP